MSDSERPLGAEFPKISYETWRERVERDLGGTGFERRLVAHTPEGIPIQPLYAPDAPFVVDPERSVSRQAPHPSGQLGLARSRRGIERRVLIDQADPKRARACAREAVEGGAAGLTLRVDPVGRGGVVARDAEELWSVVEELPLDEVSLWLEPGSAAGALAGALYDRLRHRVPSVTAVRGGWGDDPLGQLAETGELAEGLGPRLAGLARLAERTRTDAPGMRAVEISTQPYAEAGADAVEELGVALATGVAYLRALDEGGVPWDACCGQLAFTLTVGSDLFMDVAKLRALRRGWARVIEACGGSEDQRAAYLHVRSARRRRSRRDPWVNMLRATGEAAAAAIGGADAVTVLPFDTEWGEPGELGRRIARNTPLILSEESHLEHVADPALGGWYFETLTEELLGRGWELLQEIERGGGMAEALRSGTIQGRIAETAGRRRAALAHRTAPVTGVSSYPNLDEEPLASEPSDRQRLRDAVADGPLARHLGELRGQGEATQVEALAPWREPGPFEELRDRADHWREAHGRDPAVFVAAVGRLAKLKPRIDFTVNLLAAGGLRARVPDGCFADAGDAAAAYDRSDAPLAAVVAEDADYPGLTAELGPLLKQRGARGILLAGRPGEQEAAYRECGVDEFAYLGCDALSLLDRLLGRIEVSR